MSGTLSEGRVWCGTDAIFDQWHEANEMRAFLVRMFGKGGSALCGFGSLLAFGGAHEELMHGRIHVPWWLLGLGGILAAVLALLLLLGCEFFPKPDLFIRREWKLTATQGALVYRAGAFSAPLDAFQVSRDGPSWSVPIGAVARVESSLTADWQPARKYEGHPSYVRDGVCGVPKSEYQTFLLMNDGSRRVIQTVNADREGSLVLAQSIRCWLEEHRLRIAAKERSRDDSAPTPEGFDL